MARANVELTGIAAEFLEKIPLKKKGVVISVLLAKAITSGIAREVLSPLFNKEELDIFLPPSNGEMIVEIPKIDITTTIAETEVDSSKESKEEAKRGFTVKL